MAAKAKQSASVRVHLASPRKRRPGVHSKKKTSKLKRSRNYKKLYRGQGK